MTRTSIIFETKYHPYISSVCSFSSVNIWPSGTSFSLKFVIQWTSDAVIVKFGLVLNLTEVAFNLAEVQAQARKC